MPYPNEHACRIKDPGDFQKGSFRRIKRGSKTGPGARDGKQLSVVIGRLKGKTTTTTQAFRYPKDDWTEAQAQAHCKENDGAFEAAKASEAGPELEVVEELGEETQQAIDAVLAAVAKLEDADRDAAVTLLTEALDLRALSLLDAHDAVYSAFNAKYPMFPDPSSHTSWWWSTRDVFLDHPDLGDSIVVKENPSGKVYVVSFTIDGDGVAFDDPPWPEVAPTYVLLDGAPEIAAVEAVEVAEATTGRVVGIVEDRASGNGDAPLMLDIVPIVPGWGNARDGHYYPLDTLVEYAPVWKGAKMYATDHRPDEKSVRTEVSQVLESPAGLTEDGVPIARVGVFDETFAKSVRNRAALGVLDGLHCSIQASGVAETGFELDGRKGKRVVSFDREGANIDWVTQAGAGGKALRLAESEGGMSDERNNEEEVVEEPITEGEPVNISEEEHAGDPESDQQEPASLDAGQVRQAVDGTKLPAAARERLTARGYADGDELDLAIAAEIEYVKKLTGSGRPVMPPARAPAREAVSAEEVMTRRSTVNAKWLGTRAPAGGEK